MIEAFQTRDSSYDGVFYLGVRTTGIFCRPICPAKKPKVEHVEFFTTARDALFSGFRPCKRCRPLESPGTAPSWLRDLLKEVEDEPARRWREQDLRDLGLHPDRVRRWFQKHHGMTFQAFCRGRRLGMALGRIREGSSVIDAAFDHGYESLSGFNEAFRKNLGAPPRDTREATVVTLRRIVTPLGPMIAGATKDALCLFEFADRRMLETQLARLRKHLNCVMVPGKNRILDRTAKEMREYFDGRRRKFSLPLLMPGTDFQKSVWEELQEIPYGETTSYGETARRLGRRSAVRAVAKANGDNPIAIIVPCHRVVGSDGKLTGYGGGLWRKQRLLEHESGQGVMLPVMASERASSVERVQVSHRD
jgi:AraC family transcriptional regulator of adaptative response/methylated-DNA-[protein]-cysteine methyltransferase